MKKLFLSFILLFTFMFSAHAFEGLSNGTSLKIFNRINCGTSMTCTRAGNGLFQMETSGTFSGNIAATDGTFSGNISAVDVTFTGSFSGVDGTFSDDLAAVDGTFSGNISAVDATFTGDVTGDATHALYGFLQNRISVSASPTNITVSQCGSSFLNTAEVLVNLPEASTCLGCRLTFLTATATAFVINPDDADQILLVTDSAGDAISTATLGYTTTIEAMSDSEWVTVAGTGSYTDAN